MPLKGKYSTDQMVRVNQIGSYTILDVYSNDTAGIVAKYVEEIGKICDHGKLLHMAGDKADLMKELTVDWMAFESCNGKMRFHDSIVLDSPYITIDNVVEYHRLIVLLKDKNGWN